MENEKRKGSRGRLLGLIPMLLLAVLAAGLLLTPKREPDGEHGDRTAEAAAPFLVEEESFFSDFAIQKGAVYGADDAELDQVIFFCYLCVQNPGTETLPVMISGDFSDDVEGGLVTERELQAHFLTKEANLEEFWNKIEGTVSMMPMDNGLILLEPGENRFWVTFYAPHGESDTKQNRLLPPIRIAPMEDFGCVLQMNGKTLVMGQESAELLRLCRDAIAETGSPFPRIANNGQGSCIWMSFRAGEHINVTSYSNRYFGDFCVYSNDFCNYSPSPYYDISWNYELPAGSYDALMKALTELGKDTETIPLP
jgi:hypothetical protein